MDRSWYRRRLGWIPDYPDFRDYTAKHQKIQPILEKTSRPAAASLPTKCDLRPWCPPIEDQGEIGSCTANAAVGLVEYFEYRAFGKHTDASRLFLYKTTRNLLHFTGDTGAYLRSTIGALVLFGVPPEEYWPYHTDRMDEEPPAFCYSFAQNYRTISYYRLDPPEISNKELLKQIKTNLAKGLPAIFGFTVYESIVQSETDGKIPFPGENEKMLGGHAMMVVGYDDKMKINNMSSKKVSTIGAFLIRNSWGTEWGDAGYGWLPYEYVLKGLAEDWWTILKNEWVDTEMFGEELGESEA